MDHTTNVQMNGGSLFPLSTVCSGGVLPNGGSYSLQVNGEATYIMVNKAGYEALCQENEQLHKRIAELEAQHE